ncbi:MAG TPA: threonine synthase [Gemmatimonadaceae bacterium]|nr:threonine synthase [Gemmatimonadaceae bacterium]
MKFHLPREDAVRLRRRFEARVRAAGPPHEVSGVWRFREFVLEPDPAPIVSFPEGNTPLLTSARLAAWTGCEGLYVKHEGLNPTGSFKDRGMTVGVTQAMRVGARAVACASTGNTSASLAAYAALAGVPALVLVPSGNVALGKLAQTLAYGARTLVVRGDFDACLSLARDASAQLGVYLLNSVNPFRVEGQKTIVLELLQQLGWNPPDWIALPAGNLGNTAAFGKALHEALGSDLITTMPRLLAVQAAGAAPFYQSYEEGFAERYRVAAETVATAIRIGDPASWDRAVAAIRTTDGRVLAVSDDEIFEAKAVVDAAGIGCEPASAASVAGIRQARRRGIIAPGARVVAVLTGHVLKDPGALIHYHQEAEPAPARRNAPVEIGTRLEEVERELHRALARDL